MNARELRELHEIVAITSPNNTVEITYDQYQTITFKRTVTVVATELQIIDVLAKIRTQKENENIVNPVLMACDVIDELNNNNSIMTYHSEWQQDEVEEIYDAGDEYATGIISQCMFNMDDATQELLDFYLAL